MRERIVKGEEPVPEKRSGVGKWVKAWLPPIGYAGLIFYLSAQPSIPKILPSFWFADKLLHGIEYGVLGMLIYRALRDTTHPSIGLGRQILWALAIVFLYGVSDEIHQAFVPHRDASMFDLLADVIGGGTGIYLKHIITFKRGLDRD